MKNKKAKVNSKWSALDLQRFKDRNILKAITIPKKRKPSPDKSEWD
jgi:hypothetical protein